MQVDQKQKYCKLCEQKTLHTRHRMGPIAGCLLVAATLGLYLPFLALQRFKRFTCQRCGRTKWG